MKRFLIILSLILCFESFLCEKESHAAFDSLLEYETRTTYSDFFDFLIKVVEDIYTCFFSNIILNIGQINQTCIPRLITSEGTYEDDCKNSKNHETFAAIQTALFITTLVAVIALSWIPIIGQIAWIWAGIAVINVIVTCLGAYVLAPHEYINFLLDKFKCEDRGGTIENIAEGSITAADVPFFYNCNEEEVPRDLVVGDARLDTHYGNMNSGSTPYCQGGNEKFAMNNITKKTVRKVDANLVKPGSIIVQFVGFWSMIGLGGRDLCDIGGQDDAYHFSMEDVRNAKRDGATVAFYRLNSGKIQLCAATMTMAAAIIDGCTYVAPPIEMISIRAPYTEQTRCSYFLSSRTDLNSLGRAINSQATQSSYPSVGLFLQSDLHIMSTVVGCIQDLLVKVVIGTKNDLEDSFLRKIQNTMMKIVQVVLILYISLLGIKIISNPQPPQMGEVVMYVLKFAFVVVISGIAGPKIWFDQNGEKNSGLYPLLFEAMNDLSNRVLQSTNSVSPVNMCYLANNKGKNLLSENEVAIGDYPGKLQPTNSLLGTQGKIKLTVWDYVDCKLAGYLNLNSCKYNISGMISMWLVSTSIFFPKSFLLGIITITFCIVLFITMMRFVHLSIVSMFALTILVLVSPLISCFILFEYTKQTFQSWFKMILGYVLYPALIFSFVALMITTFDSIFYGTPVAKECLKQGSPCTVKQICGDSNQNDSIYCNITKEVYKGKEVTKHDPSICSVTNGDLLNSITTTYSIEMLGIKIFSARTVTDQAYDGIFKAMLKMLLFAMLFHYLVSAVLNFLETLLNIYGISGVAPNYNNVGRGMVNLGIKAASASIGIPKAAINKLRK